MLAEDLNKFEPQLILCPVCGESGTFEVVTVAGFKPQVRTVCKGCKRVSEQRNLEKDGVVALLDSWTQTEPVPADAPVPIIDLLSYDLYLVMLSGGKDSVSCLLDLIESGVPKEKIELWHHDIDGRESVTGLMDWPVTRDYCKKLAEALGLTIRFSWREGGFEREMLRENAPTAPTWFETPEGLETAGGNGKSLGTRRKFPQMATSLTTRWCSGSLKIDVCGIALNNDPRFRNKRTLVVTGERGEESAARNKYAEFEPHRNDLRNGKVPRHIDHYRPIKGWPEKDVWAIIERHKINPHPSYCLGWGRCSCMCCIFGSANMWATVRHIAPAQFQKIADYEQEFDCTIHRSKKTVHDLADMGKPFPNMDPLMIEQALSEEYTLPPIVENWVLPAGAFGENNGPT